MKWISEEDLKKHIIRDNCDTGCGYIDERDIIDMEWVEDDKFIPLFVIGSVLDKIRAEIIENSIEDYKYHGCGTNELIIEISEVLNILDRYKAEEGE